VGVNNNDKLTGGSCGMAEDDGVTRGNREGDEETIHGVEQDGVER
jgi:hypothetical protein